MNKTPKFLALVSHAHLRILLGITISLSSVVSGLILKGVRFTYVTQLSTLTILLGGIVVASLGGIGGSWRSGLVTAIATFGLFPSELTNEERLTLTRRCSAAAKATLGLMVVAQIIGLIYVMENLDKPQLIGPGIAVAFAAGLGGFLLWGLFSALYHNQLNLLDQHIQSEIDSNRCDGEIKDGFVGFLMLLFATFVVLYALQVKN